jgi:GTPase SAR1 family protein
MGNKVLLPHVTTEEGKHSTTSHHFKVLLVGSSAVGKTAIFQRVINNLYQPPYPTRMIVNIAAKIYELQNDVVTLELWDVPSFGRSDTKQSSSGPAQNQQLLLDEFESSLKHLYLRNVDGVVVVADVSRLLTFHQVKRWKALLTDYFEAENSSGAAINRESTLGVDVHPRRMDELPIILLANKRDINQTDIFLKDIRDVAEKEQLRGGFLGSALEDEEVDGAFGFLIQEMIKQRIARKQLLQSTRSLSRGNTGASLGLGSVRASAADAGEKEEEEEEGEAAYAF